MAGAKEHHDEDEFGDLDIRKKGSGRNSTLYILLACGVIFLVLITCIVGVAFVRMIEQDDRPVPKLVAPVIPPKVPVPVQDPEALKFVGAWKGQFVLNGQQRDHQYTFQKDGTLREDEFDQFGGLIRVSDAHWRLRNGQIEIDWLGGGGIEIATARWLDDNSFEYHIIQHTDAAQVGMKETFRRQ